MSYFELRNVSDSYYTEYSIPYYIQNILTKYSHKDAKILDYGCGFGQLLNALKKDGFIHIYGADIDKKALGLVSKTHSVYDVSNPEWDESLVDKFDLIVMSHVLEHLPKELMISHLGSLRKLLKVDGNLLVMVPNAQSNTGCYWAYEDFTHEYLLTAGSIYYVLKAAGFSVINFIDPDCTQGLNVFRKILKKSLLFIYRCNINFWNRITSSSYHKPSPQIFSYEIKVLAKK